MMPSLKTYQSIFLKNRSELAKYTKKYPLTLGKSENSTSYPKVSAKRFNCSLAIFFCMFILAKNLCLLLPAGYLGVEGDED